MQLKQVVHMSIQLFTLNAAALSPEDIHWSVITIRRHGDGIIRTYLSMDTDIVMILSATNRFKRYM